MIRSALLASALFAGGCASVTPRPTAQLRVVVEPDSARVYLNDRYAGNARVLDRRPTSLRTGIHFLTVQADGFFPHDVELALPEGLTTVRIALRPIPP